jgi:hypothetical protein
MAIQFSGGTIVNTTFVPANRLAIVSNMETQLLAAGWTAVSGGGTGDVQLDSAANNRGNKARVRLQDPGSGTCAQITFRTTGGVAIQSPASFINPSGSTYRVVANKFFFWLSAPGNAAPREFVCGGTLYVPSFIGTATEMIVSTANANADGTVTTGFTLRNTPYFSNVNGLYYVNANGNSYTNQGNVAQGSLATVCRVNGSGAATAIGTGPKFSSLANLIDDPLLSWGPTSSADAPFIYGQLYDCLYITESIPSETTFTTSDGSNWITVNNSATAASGSIRISIAHKVP